MFLVKIGRINLSFDVSIVTNFIDQHKTHGVTTCKFMNNNAYNAKETKGIILKLERASSIKKENYLNSPITSRKIFSLFPKSKKGK